MNQIQLENKIREIARCCRANACDITAINEELTEIQATLENHEIRITVLEGGFTQTIHVVANYSALPDPTTVPGEFYFTENSQGSKWLPGSWGGTYYPGGVLYYSNGVAWITSEVPWQASQPDVDAGLVDDEFVTPLTLANATTVSHPGHTHVAGDITDLASNVVLSISKSGDPLLVGNVTFSEGTNITLTQVGNDIEISSAGGTNGIDDVLAVGQSLTADRTIDAGSNKLNLTGYFEQTTPGTSYQYLKDVGDYDGWRVDLTNAGWPDCYMSLDPEEGLFVTPDQASGAAMSFGVSAFIVSMPNADLRISPSYNLYSSLDHQFLITGNVTPVLSINTTNRVGINKASPTVALDVVGAGVFSSSLSASNLSGTNTGDQTSIVGISGTKIQFNTSLSDGDFLYVGDTISLEENTGMFLDQVLSSDGKYVGILEDGIAGTTLAFGDLIYFAVADSRWELADADSVTTAGGVKLGMCVLAAAGDGSATVVLMWGKIRADAKFPALTIGAPVWVSTTPGEIQVTAPNGTDDVQRIVGHADTADSIWFTPSPDWQTHI